MREDMESAFGKASLGVVILVFVGVVFFLFTLWRWGRFVTSTIKYVVENLASHSGISTNLLYGIVIIATIPFFWAVGKYMHGLWFWLRGVGPSLRLYKSVHGIIIVAYVGLYFLAMFFVARGTIVGRYCAKTPEGIKVFDDPVKDPIYGIQAIPCEYGDAVEIQQSKNPKLGPQRVQVGDVRVFAFFNPVTGSPRIWYYKNSKGEYEFFDHMGYDPENGALLHAMDQQALEDAIHVQDQRAVTQQQQNHVAFAMKYVNTSVQKQAGSKQIAVLVFSNGQGHFAGFEDALSQAISSRGLISVPFFFKPPFVEEGRAERLLAADWGEATQLGISSRVDDVLIGKVSVSATNSSQFEGLITTNLNLELKCLNVDHQSVCGTRNFYAVGAGYSKSASLQNAFEKARPEMDAFVKTLHID